MSHNRSEYDRVRALAAQIGYHGENPTMSERYQHNQRLAAIARHEGVKNPHGSNRTIQYQIAKQSNLWSPYRYGKTPAPHDLYDKLESKIKDENQKKYKW